MSNCVDPNQKGRKKATRWKQWIRKATGATARTLAMPASCSALVTAIQCLGWLFMRETSQIVIHAWSYNA